MSEQQDQESRFSKEEVSQMISSRINEVNTKHSAEMTALEAKLAPKQPETKKWTRQQLETAIADQTITQAAGNSIWEAQQKQETEQQVQQIAQETVETITQTKTTNASIDAYKKFDPTLMTDGSDSRKRIEAEVRSQMAILGQPESLAIQLNALRAVYGPEENLGSPERQRQTHRDTQGGSEGTGVPIDNMPEMSARERKHYEKGIEQGRYADWAAVTKELEHANPQVRARHV